MAQLSIRSVLKTLDGAAMPILGLGVYESKCNGETEQAVLWALKHGYRHIDTATDYENEEEVGSAIKKSGIPRDQIFVTTKLWNDDHGKDKTIIAFHTSLKKLQLDWIDCYLIHSPIGGKIVQTWDAMVELQKQGLIKSIGVSNFGKGHLEELKKARPDHIPAVNQIELSPYLQLPELTEYCKKEGIIVEAYSPLTRGRKLDDPLLVDMGKKYQKSPAQLLIRWSLQSGFVCIPKSVKENRIVDNANVFDFSISDEDMSILNGKNENFRTCWNPLDDNWEG